MTGIAMYWPSITTFILPKIIGLFMKFAPTILTLCFIISAFQLFAQHRNCGTVEYLEQQIKENPERRNTLESIERHTKQWHNNTSRNNGVITIPVVVHVLYNNNTQNISTAQIQSQIDVLNEDFRRTNSDANNTWAQAADSEIEFCLATVAPNGAATTGITRTSTNVSSFGTNDAMKFTSSGGKDAWPTGDYLNMWVCAIESGLLGYAQFPGGSANTDGVVIGYQFFGTMGTASAPFNLGRTTTHEVGHWLNLYHIWGDGACGVDDNVADTPASDAANYGCSNGHSSCGSTDMVQNYMDYSDDACMNLFTTGQKNRMRALFSPGGFRASLVNSQGCGSGGNGGGGGTACTDNEVNLQIVLDQYGSETTWSVKSASGTTVASGGPYTDGTNGTSINEALCLGDGCYTFTINDAYGDGICCAYGNGSYSLSNGSTNLASGGSFASSEVKSFCLNAATCDAPDNLNTSNTTYNSTTITWNNVSGASSYTVRYRPTGTSTWTTVNASNNTKTITGLNAATGYQYKVKTNCSGSQSSAYGSVSTFTTDSAPANYCASAGSDASYEWIDKVTLGNINRTSGDDGGYYDGTATSTNLSRGSTNTLYISAGFSSESYTEYWHCWIDFNQDGDFSDNGELVVSGSSASAGTLSASFNVPSNAPLGSTRMRVTMKYDASATPCENFAYGEVEDYTVVITNGNREEEATYEHGAITLGNESSNTPAIQAFPNPASDLINLNLNSIRKLEGGQLNLMNSNGQVMRQLTLNNSSYLQLSVSDLPPGVYFINVQTDREVLTQKIIIQ